MPVEVNIDNQRGLVASVWSGSVDEAQCSSYIEGVWGESTVSAYDELLDFRNVTNFELPIEAIQRLVTRSRSVAAPEARARSALVASEAMAFGLARMYVSMRDLDDEHQREWQVLTNYDEALRWLDPSRPVAISTSD